MIVWILLLTAIYLVYKKLFEPMKYWDKLKVPYVKAKPFFGNSGSFIFKERSMAEWSQDLYNGVDEDKRYVGIYQFTKPNLIIRDLNLIKQISIKEFDHFADRRPFVSEEVEPIFGKNLVALTGERWKQMRATVSPTFTGNKMRSMFILMNECTEQFVKHTVAKIKANSGPTLTLELKDLFTRFANDIIASTAFGIKCDSLKDETNDFYMTGKKATNFGTKAVLVAFGYNLYAPLMKFFNFKILDEKITNFFKSIVLSNIKEREEKGIIRPDMIHLLMEARKGQLKHEEGSMSKDDDDTGFSTVEESHIGKDVKQEKIVLSDDDITAQAFIFFLAGFDSVSTTMSHMTYELAINQDVQTKLQKEIDATLEECKGDVTYEILMRMKYMDMVFCETLRKWPGGAIIDRICTNTYTIPAENPDEVPVTLNKNDVILFPVFGIHRDPKYFPDPNKFDPERFSDENKVNIIPSSYMPFGAGPRNCIGSRYAILEAKIIMFYFFANFKVLLVEKSEVPLQLSRGSFNMSSSNGFWVGLQLRKYKLQ